MAPTNPDSEVENSFSRSSSSRLRKATCGKASVFFTSRPGAPKRSDGGLVLEVPRYLAIKLAEQHCSGKKSALFEMRTPAESRPPSLRFGAPDRLYGKPILRQQLLAPT